MPDMAGQVIDMDEAPIDQAPEYGAAAKEAQAAGLTPGF